MKSNTEKLIDFCTKNGISVTVDNNPSEEKVAEIKEKIVRSELIRTTMVDAYGNHCDSHGNCFTPEVMKQIFDKK